MRRRSAPVNAPFCGRRAASKALRQGTAVQRHEWQTGTGKTHGSAAPPVPCPFRSRPRAGRLNGRKPRAPPGPTRDAWKDSPRSKAARNPRPSA
jgi:hypothetical protein